MNIMNIGGVHDNGEPRLQIGMQKNNGFIIEYNNELNCIVMKKASTGTTLSVQAPNSSPFKFCGQYTTYTTLVNDVSAGVVTPTNGDCYSIINAGGTDANGTSITELCLVAYANGKWFLINN